MTASDEKTRLRVALVALYPAPGAKAPGGVRAVVQNLVAGLRTYHDLQVRVIHCHSDIEESLTTRDHNVRVDYVAMPKRRLVPNTLRAIARVHQLLRQVQPDVVNTHAAHYTIASLRAGLPTVFTIHGVVHREAQVYKSSLFDRARFLLENWYERHALRHVQDIVAISPYVLAEYRNRSSARFHRIDNPLAPEFFAIPNLEEEGRLLYAGTIDERKNVIDLLRALDIVRQRIPGVRLRIAGRTTNPAYYHEVQQYVVSQDLESRVQFLGLLDNAALRDEYALCSVVVLASRQETAPMAVIEAMAAGKPVVATRVGGVPDLVDDRGSGFLVQPEDVAGFAQSVADLLADKDLRHRMGQRARELAERFRAQTVASRYRDLYYQVAGRAAP